MVVIQRDPMSSVVSRRSAAYENGIGYQLL